MVYTFFDKNSKVGGVNIALEFNEQLAEELHKPIMYSSFRDNIWDADLVDMQLMSKFNKGFRFLLCVIYVFSQYSWVIPLKNKKGISIVNAFQIILKESSRKPNKTWVDKGSEFYDSSFKKMAKR